MGIVSLGILRMQMPTDSDPTGRLQYEQTAKWAADEIEQLRTQLEEANKRVGELEGALQKIDESKDWDKFKLAHETMALNKKGE